ncbi:adenylate/guanylate cyclase domain-containing protein [Endozoicomonas sp. 4G]|uniref:adenylate/guanylate cyclase domain-containing protein n=1 Tax=Endozoicomonas sp. 4G TaxID=2872754 RepID=UPI0020788A90|nr:adenylate/guanylate cyclase domain-containing protein [Endozoicomonas sp. 4G]
MKLKTATREFCDFENFSQGKPKIFTGQSAPKTESVSTEGLADVPAEEYVYQNALRPYFAKQGINTQAMGAHPDFAHLKDTGDTIHHHIVTLFIDIKGSTRLNLLLDIQKAFQVKNRVLQTAIEVVRSLDGHPHRLMGDALMAFFGGDRISKEDAIANAINAATMLRTIMKEYVFPDLDGYLPGKSEMAVRIGFDFGDDTKVLWGTYGFGDASEVTAQGLNVDFASKLQSHAGANNAMLGQSLYEFVDFPEQYLQVKETSKGPNTLLTPNISYADGRKINYGMRLLKTDEYQRLLPLPTEDKANFSGITRVTSYSDIQYFCDVEEEEVWQRYPSVSRFLDKELSLRFTVKVANWVVERNGGLDVKFTKQNHGIEAGEHIEPVITQKPLNYSSSSRNEHPPYRSVEKYEGTLYRGLHTMNVKVLSRKHNRLLFEDWIGVYIV